MSKPCNRGFLLWCVLTFAAACSSTGNVSGPDYIVTTALDGDTAELIAERILGDYRRGWLIRELNEQVAPGDPVLVPRRDPRPSGVFSDGYEGVIVLAYHHIKDEKRCTGTTVCRDQFQAQLNYLRDNGYQIIALDQLAQNMRDNVRSGPKTVVITFDDGWKSTYDLAYPLLLRRGIPATLFIYSDFINARAGLTWAQLKEMSDSGIMDIQSHSKSHANLPKTLRTHDGDDKKAILAQELDQPAVKIEQKLGHRPYAIAYPYGASDGNVVSYLKRSDYDMALTVTRGPNSVFAHPLLVRRTMIYGEDTLEKFVRKVDGFERVSR